MKNKDFFSLLFFPLIFLRTLIGFNLFGASFCIVNTYLYFKFERPLKLERQQQLERELLEADLAGFKVK